MSKKPDRRFKDIKAKRLNITLTPDLDALAISLGNGNRSKGIAIALKSTKAIVDRLNGQPDDSS